MNCDFIGHCIADNDRVTVTKNDLDHAMLIEKISIGTDIEKIDRFESLICKEDFFLGNIITIAEINYCKAMANPSQHVAARFCAKEATIKALSSFNIQDISFLDMEISNLDHGVPIMRIKKK